MASLVSSEEEQATALLHDVLEDSAYTVADLKDQGLPLSVIKAVSLLTKPRNKSYQEYLEQIKENELARRVKLADLKHNSDLSRLKTISAQDRQRLEKYQSAMVFLNA